MIGDFDQSESPAIAELINEIDNRRCKRDIISGSVVANGVRMARTK